MIKARIDDRQAKAKAGEGKVRQKKQDKHETAEDQRR
jgi:hypothetical protein